MKEFKFNLNSYIRVKLTEKGVLRYINYVDESNDRLREQGRSFRRDYALDKVGEYSRWQAWEFMALFGGSGTGMGSEQLYDCNIICEQENEEVEERGEQ